MRKWINWKSIVIVSGIIIILSGSFFTIHMIEKREREASEMEDRRIREAYNRVNIAFGVVHLDSTDRNKLIERGEMTTFFPQYRFISRYSNPLQWLWLENRFGIMTNIYIPLRFYESRTGIYLSYKKVMDYFSEEFEPDGSLRLYNNGNHPEIEAFVNWFWNNLADFFEFDRRIEAIYNRYVFDNGLDEEMGLIFEVSPQMIEVLVRAVEDPDYVLDLTSLHEQGY